MDILTELNQKQGITIVMITHESDIALYARRTIHFRDGHVEREDHNGEAA
jgi:putative ABC transport system ATP-binding protein